MKMKLEDLSDGEVTNAYQMCTILVNDKSLDPFDMLEVSEELNNSLMRNSSIELNPNTPLISGHCLLSCCGRNTV